MDALTVVLAVTVSAPLVADDAGDSVTWAVPLLSVSADAALRSPKPPATEKVTTAPDTAEPVLSTTLAVTVAGEAAVTVVLDSDSETVTSLVVEPSPPPPTTGVPASELLPPPQPASANAAAAASSQT